MRDEIIMDTNKFITEIHKRPALWNQRHVSYHNRELTKRIWMEIAAMFNLPKPILKAKWKGLRDTYRAELKKEQVYLRSHCERNRPIWIHYESLSFLKEQMLPKPPVWERSYHTRDECDGTCRLYSNHTNGNGCNGNHDSLSEHFLNSSINRIPSDPDVDIKDEPHDSEYQDASSLNDDGEAMLQNLSPAQVLMNLDRNGRDDSQGVNGIDTASNVGINNDIVDRNNDDNYFFLMSLLPHIKKLPADRNMYLRMKIQELVYNEVKNNQPNGE
ncbi:uncharacterized protein LOC131675308 [Phymastichus coffea]|uniref:uncharacterized protein LOC131675308 n=1 Tax=Phymastichus coffea TaxID=108790 RepID=UPI00273B0505|nr:uncharacterized protein LOC131675308 [Phymastichus coffea]